MYQMTLLTINSVYIATNEYIFMSKIVICVLRICCGCAFSLLNCENCLVSVFAKFVQIGRILFFLGKNGETMSKNLGPDLKKKFIINNTDKISSTKISKCKYLVVGES